MTRATREEPITGWPDGPPPGSNRTPTTIPNVRHMLAHEGIVVRYNLVKRDLEIVVPEEAGTVDNRANVQMSRVKSRAAKHGLSTRLIDEYVQAIGDDNAYNPVADWIASREWDRRDRLPDILATVTTVDEYPPALKATLMTKWLLSAAAAIIVGDSYRARGVLVLQGAQGIGKTSWLARLVSDPKLRSEVVRLDHHIAWANKDSLVSAIDSWMTEMGELEGTLKRDLPLLKSFITATVDKIRRPYDRRESVYPRRTAFAATVNEAGFLIDATGNTRWWTVAAASLDYTHDIDGQQLFAQLAEMVRAGHQWWLNPHEEAALEAWNARHRAANAIAEQIAEAIDVSPGDANRPVMMTASEALRRIGYAQPTNAQAKESAAALRGIYGESRRIGGFEKWPVRLRDTVAKAWVRPKDEDPSLPPAQ